MKESESQPLSTNENFSAIQVLGWTISIGETSGKKFVVDPQKKSLIFNQNIEITREEISRFSALAVAREVALSELLQGTSPSEAIKFFSDDREFTGEILRLTGARLLRERDLKMSREISSNISASDSVVQEFKTACALYLATGYFTKVSPSVKKEIEKLPISPKTGEHLLSSFTSDRVALSRKKDYYERFILPSIKRLREIDADLSKSDSESFQPSTDDSPENQELDESQIMQRVLPFVGGYFREKVQDGVDWKTMQVVATGVQSERLVLPEEERVLNATDKIYTFSGINGKEFSKGKITAPMPSNSEILPETATKGLIIRRSVNGTYTLEWADGFSPSDNYEFSFVKKEIPQDWQRKEPAEIEQEISHLVTETLSVETRDFLEGLRQAQITDASRVRQVANRVQKMIEYVGDSSVGQKLSSSGSGYFTELERIKKGDCDVCNFYALAQIRLLGISCRMVTGFHVRRDKRFPFSALAGTKHAWLEWFDKEKGLWTRIDATPPKKEEDDEEEKDKESEGGGGEEKEMNTSERENPVVEPDDSDEDPFGLPFEDEDMAKLQEFLSQLDEVDASEPNADKIFKNIYGIERKKWDEVLGLAEKVGKQKIPQGATIEKKSESTVAEEWQRIYEILFIAYRLPDRSRRVMGRQSQGGDLTDPVSAGIDIMTGSEDPFGFETRTPRETTYKLPISFSNDFILDATASMEAKNKKGMSLLELERQFVISSIFEGHRLNERIKQRSSELTNVPFMTNHVLSIHGSDRWQEIIKNEPAGIGELVSVNEALKKSTPGAGAMAEAIESYVATLENDVATITALREKTMVKTLTIITDGNLWCSVCGAESCTYELHAGSFARVNKALNRARKLGVVINAIGFTEQSRPVAQLFAVEGDPQSALVVEDLEEALVAHHSQIERVMKPIVEVAQRRIANQNK